MEADDIRRMWDGLAPSLNERQRRLYAATLARAYGYGGATAVHQQTGMALNTITAGKRDLEKRPDGDPGRIRRPGGGATALELRHPRIHDFLHEIVDGRAYGDPRRVLSWTTESLRKIGDEFTSRRGVPISHVSIGAMLGRMGYGKQANQENPQVGAKKVDKNAQFEFIDYKATGFL